ncbi:ATP-binding protein [Dysgonomonas mossii]|uniref:ATP-binding protein n=1 Tax=Dysgonomonas mossii TaxID=163665 RepID=A0A4Y9IJD3_9BACT|nr:MULTISPECIES: ATP-binding protein [Dysgonomonas]MBD8388891.1 ATP-binding protein [Dysgonomonas sp. BGC7]MBF0762698.1 ATP-binding protein [Dysgonomonas mossii]TFU86878.1 ATP-binding protein [Dysgonomonas mossii]
MDNRVDNILQENSIFRIGTVFSVEGREVKVKVDKVKNASHLLYKGSLIKNVSVGGYVKIEKGFISIIAKIEGESIKEEKLPFIQEYGKEENKINRILNAKLLGYIENAKFERGIKELPLIDNECFLLNSEEFKQIHQFVKQDDKPIQIGTLALERGQEIYVGVNSLFSSHIGIFGNTGSGKSYTLAKIYRQLFRAFEDQDKFKRNARFLLFDFNGEYNGDNVIISNKKVYNLSTKDSTGKDKLPFFENDLLDKNLFSILASASEKTQQPFIGRTLEFYKKVMGVNDSLGYFHNILRKRIEEILCMSDKVQSKLLLDYIEQILPKYINKDGEEGRLIDDFAWRPDKFCYYLGDFNNYQCFIENRNFVKETKLYKQVEQYEFESDFISRIIHFLYLQLIHDVLTNRANNEHIAPAINKLKSFQKDIAKVIEIKDSAIDFWDNDYLAVINLNEANINIKKLIPLLISHKLYSEHKNHKTDNELEKSLNIIIDEAHNILSYESLRESESWKDYRLETFEEIIKEGRKFGVFLTIASQRPSDISTTIISQLHNYFIHRLVNNKDLDMVEKAISYLDQVSTEALPILGTGMCILSGQLVQMPVIISIDTIESQHKPNNETINLLKNWED